MKALIVVDVQYDFMPGGALAVNDGDGIIPFINSILPNYELVIFTQDWHPADNIYFADSHEGKQPFEQIELNGKMDTLWPAHCIQNTRGAELHDDLKFASLEGGFYIFKKGDETNCHPYGGFGDKMKDTGLKVFLKERNVTDVDVVGLALDYCVKDTALDAKKLGFNTTVLLKGTRAIAESFSEVLDEFTSVGIEIII